VDVVTIEGEVPSAYVPSLIAASTIGVVTYQRNPLTEVATPNKAYEYAVAEKAMVVADLGGLRALLGDTVLYYRPGDAVDLAQKIATLLGNPRERERLGQAVRRRIDDHRWEIMGERLVETYRECLSAKDRTRVKGAPRGSTVGAPGRLSGGR
jgi:glycosyltransferase involved in cell wall biosynthesis